jgi:S1-C subfamily serine protease
MISYHLVALFGNSEGYLMTINKGPWIGVVAGVFLLQAICLAEETAQDPVGIPAAKLPYGDLSNTNRINREVFFFSAPEEVARKAAQNGDSIAQFALGHKLMKAGKYAEAITWLEKAASTGSADAKFLFELGKIFQKSKQEELVDVWTEIRQLVNDAAVKNVPYAQWGLGQAVPYGQFGYKKDNLLGYYWGSRAASNGLCLAVGTMAEKDYSEGEWEKSLRWYLKLADNGEVVSKHCAACILVLMTTLDSSDGSDTKQKLFHAKALLKDCKTNGMWTASVEALDFLDMLSDDKHPIILLDSKKKPHDIQLLRRIAQEYDPDLASEKYRYWNHVGRRGESESVFGVQTLPVGIQLSWFIEDHQRNRETAMTWYRFAAENGDAHAAAILGCHFTEGKGVQIDKNEAKRWNLVAARAGNGAAQWNLGILLWNDFTDYVEAYKWLNVAIASDQKKPFGKREEWKVRNLENLEKIMTREQVLEAQRRSTTFIEGKPEVPEGESGPRQEAALECKATGTGFFITVDGYIITASHVVQNAASVAIMTQTGKVKAKIVRADTANDIAILKAEGRFTAIPLENSKTVKLGDAVTTIGFPNPEIQGFSPKLTKGEIGSLFGIQDDPRHFQISAPIQPGNSGGPLLNASGNTIGTLVSRLGDRVTLKATGMLPQNVNYALKSAYVLAMIEAMPDISDKLPKPRSGVLTTDEIVKGTEPAIVMVLVY